MTNLLYFDSTLSLTNTGYAGSMILNSGNNSAINAVNDGTVNGKLTASTSVTNTGAVSVNNITNNGTAGEVVLWTQDGGSITFDNQGKVTNKITVTDSTFADLKTGGAVTLAVRTQSGGVADTETLQKVIQSMSVDMSGANLTKVYVVTTDANGNKTARYTFSKDGTLELVDVYVDTSAMALWLAMLTLSGVSLLTLRRKTAS